MLMNLNRWNTLIQIIWFTAFRSGMSVLIFSVLALLFVSAMASGTEAALFAVPISKVKAFLDEKRRCQALQTIKDDMGSAITTVVIINNIANIVGSIAVGSLASKHFGEYLWFGYIPA